MARGDVLFQGIPARVRCRPDVRTKGEIKRVASLAQQESQSLSQNVKLGMQYRYQKGKVQVNHNRFLGYTKNEEGDLIVDKEQAAVVQRIYYEFLDGATYREIKAGLEADGILNGAGNRTWTISNIHQILSNEKYIGDALLQKTYTVDFLSKKRVKNSGIVPQYYVENSHEAIIPRDVFMRAQEEKRRRSNLRSCGGKKRRNYSNKYALSGITFCEKCGDTYRRVAWKSHGRHNDVWRCCTRVEHGPKKGCDAPTIKEKVLQDGVIRALNKLLGKRSSVLEGLKESATSVITEEKTGRLEEIESRLKELQEELLSRTADRLDYDELADEILLLRKEKQTILAGCAIEKGKEEQLEDLIAFLDEQETEVLEWNEKLVRRLVGKVTVREGCLTVMLKSGTEIDVEI